jgi:glycosyltransferase involved in cell wall biosynthesis
MLSFNKAAYLEQAIRSVLMQEDANWELLVADDCSSDCSWQVCCDFASRDQRVRIFRRDERLGIPRNRSAAFREARGDLVCHLDCDDMLYPWSLRVMRGAFSHFEDLAYAYSDFALIDGQSAVIQYGLNPNYDGNLSRFGWRHFGMYRRMYAERLGGYNDLISRPCEDGDLVMRMANQGLRIGRVPYVLYMHRYLGSNHQSSLAGQCGECMDQPICHYYQIWSRHAGQSL